MRSTGVLNAIAPPAILDVALQRQHVAVAVDDAGLGEWNAATHAIAGSIRIASAPSSMRRPSTPLRRAWA